METMPIYDYHCATCGPFEVRRPMNESAEPAACPKCHASTVRVLVAPRLNLMVASTRKAEIRNEKSAHAPEVVHRVAPEASHSEHGRHSHGHKSHKVARPWMVGH
jgi:putative FmdB family regulatory protein